MQNKNTILNNKPKPFKKKRNKKLLDINFAQFDPDTGEKIANPIQVAQQNNLAKMEAVSDALGRRRVPSNKEETLKDAATGGSLSYLVANSAITKDSKRIKALTMLRKKGLIGLTGALTAGLLSRIKQRGEYNRQQAARELLTGKKTARSIAYRNYLRNKYKEN